MKLPDNMDPECIPICEAMNEIPGIETSESCCGHGRHGFWIFFKAENMQALATIAYAVYASHCGFEGWQVIAHTVCPSRPARFLLEGPKDEKSYEQATRLAAIILGLRDEKEAG